MPNNPLLVKYAYSHLRPFTTVIYILIYLCVTVLIAFFNGLGQDQAFSDINLAHLAATLHYQLLAIEIILLCVWMPVNTASVIKTEVGQKSYDFFRILPISGCRKALGILIGQNLLVGVLALINGGLLVILGLFGGVFLRGLGYVMVLIVSVCALFSTISLLTCVCFPTFKRGQGLRMFLVVLVVLMSFPVLARLFFFMRRGSVYDISLSFFGLDLPAFLLVSALALYGAAWALVGIIRKFNQEHEPLFSRPGSLFFLAAMGVIAAGLFFQVFREGRADLFRYYLACSLMPLVLCILGSIRWFDHYMEGMRSRHRRVHAARLLWRSNLLVWLAQFVVWIGWFAAARGVLGMSLSQDTGFLLGVLSYYLLFVLLIECMALYNRHNRVVAIGVTFLIVVHVFTPLIYAAVRDQDSMARFSALGYLFLMSAPDRIDQVPVAVLSVNAFLSLVPLGLVLARYAYILQARRQMTQA